MAINKAKTSIWMKAILILIILAFVSSFISIVASPFAPKTNTGSGSTDTSGTVSAVNTQYEGQVQALNATLASQPTSYTVLVSLANAYYDWAAQLSRSSQNSTATVNAAIDKWTLAKDAYGRAVAVKPGESAVEVDYSIASFYSGDTSSAIGIAEGVTKSNASYAPAWFNLGIYYQTAGNAQKAIAAFEQYLKLDPSGKQGDSAAAKKYIQELKAK